MADVAMVTKVQFFLNLFQTSRNFTVMFLVTFRFANRDIKFQNGSFRVEKIQDGCRYLGNRGTKIMGWGDVRYCFAMAILVKSPKQRLETYCFCSVSYYYYYYYYYSCSCYSPFFLCTMNLSTADLRNYRTEFHETWWSYRYICF